MSYFIETFRVTKPHMPRADSEGPDQTAHAQSDQGLRCLPKEPLESIDFII